MHSLHSVGIPFQHTSLAGFRHAQTTAVGFWGGPPLGAEQGLPVSSHGRRKAREAWEASSKGADPTQEGSTLRSSSPVRGQASQVHPNHCRLGPQPGTWGPPSTLVIPVSHSLLWTPHPPLSPTSGSLHPLFFLRIPQASLPSSIRRLCSKCHVLRVTFPDHPPHAPAPSKRVFLLVLAAQATPHVASQFLVASTLRSPGARIGGAPDWKVLVWNLRRRQPASRPALDVRRALVPSSVPRDGPS